MRRSRAWGWGGPRLPLPALSSPPPPSLHPRLCGGGGGEMRRVPCGKLCAREALRARARGVHTRVRARLCKRVYVYPCLFTRVCSCIPWGSRPKIVSVTGMWRQTRDCACACTTVCLCAQRCMPVWVTCTGLHGWRTHCARWIYTFVYTCWRADRCLALSRAPSVSQCVPCCVHVSVCTSRVYHVI